MPLGNSGDNDDAEDIVEQNLAWVKQRILEGKVVVYRTGYMHEEDGSYDPESGMILVGTADSMDELLEDIQGTTGFESEYTEQEYIELTNFLGASPWRIIHDGKSTQIDLAAFNAFAADMVVVYGDAGDIGHVEFGDTVDD